MKQFTITQVSIFYLLVIIMLSWVGFTQSIRIGQSIGIALGDAIGATIGAIIGVLLSYMMFQYARRNGMIAY